MARWSEQEENFLLNLRSMVTLYRPEYMTVEFDESAGHSLMLHISHDIKMTVSKLASEGWVLDLFKRNKNGSASKKYPQISRVLVAARQTHVGEDEVCDRLYDAFERLLGGKATSETLTQKNLLRTLSS